MNFNVLYAAIQAELNDFGPRTGTRIVKWINEGHKFICQSRRWGFLRIRKSDQITIAPAGFPFNIETSIKVATIATAAKSIQQIWDVTDGTYQPVEQSTLEQIRDHFPSETGVSDSPLFWYYNDGNTISVFPETSDSRIFIFSFEKKIPSYAAGATTAMLIPDEYIDVLQEYVLFKAYLYKSDERATLFAESYKNQLNAMITAESNKAGIIYDQPYYEEPGGALNLVTAVDSFTAALDFTVATAGVEVAIAHNLGVIPTEIVPVVKSGNASFANVYPGTTPWSETHVYLTASLAGDYSVMVRM